MYVYPELTQAGSACFNLLIIWYQWQPRHKSWIGLFVDPFLQKHKVWPLISHSINIQAWGSPQMAQKSSLNCHSLICFMITMVLVLTFFQHINLPKLFQLFLSSLTSVLDLTWQLKGQSMQGPLQGLWTVKHLFITVDVFVAPLELILSSCPAICLEPYSHIFWEYSQRAPSFAYRFLARSPILGVI